MENVILIGMPGSGKSTVGVLLAKALGWGFLDTDLLLQQETGKQLYETIRDEGLAAFLALEGAAVCTLRPAKPTVIATGGSVVLEEAAMAHLTRLGTTVYLQLPLSEVERRLGDITTRGVAMTPGETLGDVYALRTPLYERYAHLTVAAAGQTLEETVAAVLRALAERERKPI